jgi:hypothetical protein
MTAKSINTLYGGGFFRSRTEAKWAVFFDACGIPYDYEFRGYHLDAGRYLPDFWLPTFQMFFEIKGVWPSEDERQKCVDLAASMDRVVLLAQGVPEERFQIRWYDSAGEDDRLYVIARDRNADAGFWLVADDEGDSSRWFGGGVLGEPHRGPMFSGALERAYQLAQMIRFEHGARTHRVQPIPEADPARHEPRATMRGAA